MPKVNAPMTSEGPSGAMAPPNAAKRRDRHDGERRDRDHDQAAEQAARLAARRGSAATTPCS